MSTKAEQYREVADLESRVNSMWKDYASDLPPGKARVVQTEAGMVAFVRTPDGGVARVKVYEFIDARVATK